MTLGSEIIVLTASSEMGPGSWVSSVTDGLKLAVNKITGINFELKLEILSDALTIKASVPIIVVISEKILNGQEANFLNRISETVDNKNPLYIIFKEPLSAEYLPSSLRNKPVYNFFDINPVTNINRHYSINTDEEVTKLFWSKILDLAFDLTSVLKKNERSTSSAKAVYLAETTPDQYENRDIVKGELIQRSFAVYPDHLLTGTHENMNSEIDEYMANCFMSVHILGNHYGELIPGSEYSLIELQYRAAAKRWKETTKNGGKKLFQRIIWIKPGLRPTDERHKWFLGSLRIEEKDASTEIMQTPVEDLKSNLRNKISVFEENDSELTNTGNNSGIYLIYEKKDADKTDELKKYLMEKGNKILSLDFSKDSSLLLSQHYEYLKKSSAAVICDFEGNDFWIKSKLKDLLKSPGLGRTEQFKVKALYTNTKTQNKLVTANSLLMLDASKDIALAMEPFIQKINANG
jgi:hypothetical protein